MLCYLDNACCVERKRCSGSLASLRRLIIVTCCKKAVQTAVVALQWAVMAESRWTR